MRVGAEVQPCGASHPAGHLRPEAGGGIHLVAVLVVLTVTAHPIGSPGIAVQDGKRVSVAGAAIGLVKHWRGLLRERDRGGRQENEVSQRSARPLSDLKSLRMLT